MFNMCSIVKIAVAVCALFAGFDFVSAGRSRQASRQPLREVGVELKPKDQVMAEISHWRDALRNVDRSTAPSR